MITVKRDFSNRVQEIELYFSFMEDVMLNNAVLSLQNGTTKVFTSDINKIFKANSFLLLYNLSESCIKNAIEQIYVTLDNSRISYDDLKKGIRKELIKYLKNNINVNDLVDDINEVAYDLILRCFNSEKLLSGNLDARKVKELANKYGFSSSILPISNADGTLTEVLSDNLLTVKTRRNDLAHGIYSFKECGKDYTIQDLIAIKNHVIEYLRQILDNIELYITNREYLN